MRAGGWQTCLSAIRIFIYWGNLVLLSNQSKSFDDDESVAT